MCNTSYATSCHAGACVQLIVLARIPADQHSLEAGKTWSWVVTSLVVAGCVEKVLAVAAAT